LTKYDIGNLRAMARTDPASLDKDMKNALLAAALEDRGISGARRISETGDLSDPEDRAREREIQEGIWDGDDPDRFLGDSVGGQPYMRRITSAARRKDLTPMQQEKMFKLAVFLWDRNPLAARVIRRAVNYVLGEGIQVVARHKKNEVRNEIQKIIDQFWFDPRNRLDVRLLRWALAWRAYGELALRVGVNPVTGLVRLAYISPEMITDVKTEPGDIEQLEKLVVRKVEQDENGNVREMVGKTEDLAIVATYEGIPISSDEKLLERTPGRQYGQAFYFAANTLPDMVRGRSDLLAIADVLDAYDQFIWTRMERQAMLLAFVWSIELAGASNEQIDAWIKKHRSTPRPGSLQVHNEKVKWNPVSPTLGSSEGLQESDLIINYIATSQGMPGMWFGREQDPNKANGSNLTGPTLKDLTCLQNEFKGLISRLLMFVLDVAIQQGRLPDDLDLRQSFDIQLPDLSQKDMALTATTLATLANALTAARTGQMIDLQTSQEVFLLALAPTGIEADIAEVRKRIQQETEDAAAKQEEETEKWYQQQAAYQQSAQPAQTEGEAMPEEEYTGYD